METRTRFKEDCDVGSALVARTLCRSWKPGLASKRIATTPRSLWSPCPSRGWKPGLASKRIATIYRFRYGSGLDSTKVGNQDSLQRGLRLDRCRHSDNTPPHVGNQDSLQRGLRHLQPPVDEVALPKVGNQDSLQRGLRQNDDRVPDNAEPHVGNQDSLQRGLRREALGVGAQLAYMRWKPGLASKRIATCHLLLHGPQEVRDRWKPGLASKRIATRERQEGHLKGIGVGNQDSLQRGLRRIVLVCMHTPSSPPLETRTRFKEDCDPT